MPADAVAALATIAAAIIGVAGTLVAVMLQRRQENGPTVPAVLAPADGQPPHSQPSVTATKVVEPALPHLERVLQAKILRCGAIKHPPLCDFQHTREGWSFGGLYVELAKVACAKAGLQPEFVAVDWSELSLAFADPGLGLDLVLSVFETRQRLGFADFAAPFHRVGVGAVALASSRKVQSVGDLQNDDVRIVVTKGEMGWECAVYDLKIPKYRLIVVESASLPEIVDYVRNGRADVAIFDDVTCDSCVSNDPELIHLFANDSLYLCRNSVMIPKHDGAFGQWVEKIFLEARVDPSISAMEETILESSHGMIRKFR